jgi:hypothetical protein
MIIQQFSKETVEASAHAIVTKSISNSALFTSSPPYSSTTIPLSSTLTQACDGEQRRKII